MLSKSDAMLSADPEIVRESTDDQVRISLSYGELKLDLTGKPESVLQSITSLLLKQIPTLKLAQKIYLNYTGKELIDEFQEFIRITPEGPRVISDTLSDKQLIAFQLIAQKIACETGSAKSEAVSLSGIQEVTGLKMKSISSRLSELSKGGLVMRDSLGDEMTGFRISTMGIKWLLETAARKRSSG